MQRELVVTTRHRSGWGPWSHEAIDLMAEPTSGGSPLLWLGGGLSIALWAWATALALQFL
ncbi:MAG TPA: hypothetical protein VFE82_16290 [Ramlibacter sp.]|jgi:hypothetical protein|uniref:hypothetical protein n=1 Tax=Ramlibacter sp. TaxID=1917967 RepID=UPI002D346208|nr:hypothetical protein [Ramlibacter sp.]HZY20032.1 hypothetical protein [Ramlibacter sp.]